MSLSEIQFECPKCRHLISYTDFMMRSRTHQFIHCHFCRQHIKAKLWNPIETKGVSGVSKSYIRCPECNRAMKVSFFRKAAAVSEYIHCIGCKQRTKQHLWVEDTEDVEGDNDVGKNNNETKMKKALKAYCPSCGSEQTLSDYCNLTETVCKTCGMGFPSSEWVLVKHKKNDNIQQILDERGARYGKPEHHFPLVRKMFSVWESSVNALDEPWASLTPEQIDSVLHGVYIIFDKLARTAHDPTWKDNYDDIEGYARCIKDALGLEKK